MNAKKYAPSLWCVYHIPTGKGFEGLLYDEVRTIATVNMASEWLVWKEGWTDWRMMHEHEGLREPLIRPLNLESPPAIPQTLITEATTKITKTNFSLKAVNDDPQLTQSYVVDVTDKMDLADKAVPFDKVNFVQRKNERFERRYELIIKQDDKVFTTYSLDVSIGGMKLEDPLPQWLGEQFKVRIKKGKSLIELLGYRLDQESEKPGVQYRLGFLPLKNSEDESNLENWLKAA